MEVINILQTELQDLSQTKQVLLINEYVQLLMKIQSDQLTKLSTKDCNEFINKHMIKKAGDTLAFPNRNSVSNSINNVEDPVVSLNLEFMKAASTVVDNYFILRPTDAKTHS